MENLKVIFVEPQFDGNIGSICRVMKNFGFSDLILVNPPKIGDDACRFAKHASDILENMEIKKTFEEAVSDLDYIMGTTGIDTISDKKFLRRTFKPSELSGRLDNINGKIGVVFGRENYGLYNEELEKCDMLIKIPTSDDYPILNVSHAVAIVLYELSFIEWGADREIANKDEMKLLHVKIHEVLEDVEYPQHKQKKAEVMVKRVFGRAIITKYEYHMLMGILSKIKRKI